MTNFIVPAIIFFALLSPVYSFEDNSNVIIHNQSSSSSQGGSASSYSSSSVNSNGEVYIRMETNVNGETEVFETTEPGSYTLESDEEGSTLTSPTTETLLNKEDVATPEVAITLEQQAVEIIENVEDTTTETRGLFLRIFEFIKSLF